MSGVSQSVQAGQCGQNLSTSWLCSTLCPQPLPTVALNIQPRQSSFCWSRIKKNIPIAQDYVGLSQDI